MPGRLITYPVRASLRAAELVVRGAAALTGAALSAVEERRRSRRQRGSASPAPPMPKQPPPPIPAYQAPPAEPAAPADPAPVAPAPSVAADVSPPEPVELIEEPIHVSEEAELVSEVAEPGAEEGAGAQVTVLEPWEGYARMTARDVIARLATANPTELAAVELYEGSHRARRTVLAAVQRRMRA